MHSFCVEIITQTASFRNPEFQNFHKTLDLPPPTTIIGFAGAALGLSPKMAQEFFEETPFYLGIAGNFGGRVTDTWKYSKMKSQMHLYYPGMKYSVGKIQEECSSIIQREHLIHNQFFLFFGSENESKLQELKTAFLNPVFALTMGNSDSLAMVKTIDDNIEIVQNDKLKNCIIAGDVVGEVIRNASKSLEFSIYQTSEPITFDLPIRFQYSSDYGKRIVSDTSTFSFIGDEMQLNFETKGVIFKGAFIPIFQL